MHLSLARRVQLAVLAHIRHTHTRYDELLKETNWATARKVVETLCLDILVKWRGDEETGRDQLDEILREVVVISDSETDSSDVESDDSSIELIEIPNEQASSSGMHRASPKLTGPQALVSIPDGFTHQQPPHLVPAASTKCHRKVSPTRAAEKKDQRGFKRYRAWQEAIQRSREKPSLSRDPGEEQSMGNGGRAAAEYGNSAHPIGRNSGLPQPPQAYEGALARTGARPCFSTPAQLLPKGIGREARKFASERTTVSEFASTNPEIWPYAHTVPRGSARRGNSASIRRSASPGASRYKDLLVPSIESPYPEIMPPSFVRALPPKWTVLEPEECGSRVQNLAEPNQTLLPNPPFRGDRVAEETTCVGRRVMSDSVWRRGVREDGMYQQSFDLEPHHHASLGEEPMASATLHQHSSMAGVRQGQYHSGPSVSRRILVDAPGPREQSTPILMENRGDFFERISPPVRRLEPARISNMNGPFSAQQMGTCVEPGLWNDGSIVSGNNGAGDDVEVIPVSRPYATHVEDHRRCASSGPLPCHRSSATGPPVPEGPPFIQPSMDWQYPPRHVVEYTPATSEQYQQR